MQASGLQDDEGAWRAGQAPDIRTDVEVPNFKQQEEQDRLKIRNIEVQEWRSQAGGSSEDEDPREPYLDLTGAVPTQPMDPDEEHNNIPQVDDAASIRQNRLQDGQIYYNPGSVPKPEADERVMSRPRHWNDGPSLPLMTVTTSNLLPRMTRCESGI